jgi:hypothetical protein
MLGTLGCGGDDNGGTGPGNNQGTALNGTFAAQIGGAGWSATGTVSVDREDNFLGLGASGFAGSTAYALVIGLGNVTGPGTYTVAAGNANGSSIVVGSSTGAGWTTFLGNGTGSVTITTLTANRVAGTFTADASPTTGGATGTLQIRNGAFDVTY